MPGSRGIGELRGVDAGPGQQALEGVDRARGDGDLGHAGVLAVVVAVVMFLGRRNRCRAGLPALVGLSTIGLSAHWWVTSDAEMVIWRRHLPSCMTSGKSVPQGTLLRTKCPLASVRAVAIG